MRTDQWNGTAFGPIPYNYTCIDNSCTDLNMQSTFEVVYHRPTDNLLVLYGCIEMTEMVQVVLEDSMPLILEMVKKILNVELPEFIMQIVVDSAMRALLNNMRIAHL